MMSKLAKSPWKWNKNHVLSRERQTGKRQIFVTVDLKSDSKQKLCKNAKLKESQVMNGTMLDNAEYFALHPRFELQNLRLQI